MTPFGLGNLTGAVSLLENMERTARPLWEPELPSALRRERCGKLSWPFLLEMVCDVRRTLKKVSRSVFEKVLAAAHELGVRKAMTECAQRLFREGTAQKGCDTEAIPGAAIRALAAGTPRAGLLPL